MSVLVRELEPQTIMGASHRKFERQCACGALFVVMPMRADAETVEDNGVCPPCRDQLETVRRERVDQARRLEATTRTIPARFLIRFGAPELLLRVKPPSLVGKAKGTADAQTIVLLGPKPGVGKTTLASALLLEVATRRRTTGVFVTAFELAEARRQSRLGNGE